MKLSALSFLALATSISAAPGDGDWAVAYTKAKAALAKLSTANKVSMVTGQGWMKGPCVGNIAAQSAIGFPQLCLQDGPLGYVSIEGLFEEKTLLMLLQSEICTASDSVPGWDHDGEYLGYVVNVCIWKCSWYDATLVWDICVLADKFW